jgi:hypothetical protein
VYAGERLIAPPPAGDRLPNGGECGARSKPGGTDGGGVTSLLRGVKDLLYAPVVLRVRPSLEKAANRVNPQDVLKRKRDLGTHDFAEGNVQDGVLTHRSTHSSIRWSLSTSTMMANSSPVHSPVPLGEAAAVFCESDGMKDKSKPFSSKVV